MYTFSQDLKSDKINQRSKMRQLGSSFTIQSFTHIDIKNRHNLLGCIDQYLGAICDESPLFKQHYLWQYVQLLHNRLLYRCTSI